MEIMLRAVAAAVVVAIALTLILFVAIVAPNTANTKVITKTSLQSEYVYLGKLKLSRGMVNDTLVWLYEGNITEHVKVLVISKSKFGVYYIYLNYDQDWLRKKYIKYFKITKEVIEKVNEMGINLTKILLDNRTIIKKKMVSMDMVVVLHVPWYAVEIYELMSDGELPLYPQRSSGATMDDPFIKEVLVPFILWFEENIGYLNRVKLTLKLLEEKYDYNFTPGFRYPLPSMVKGYVCGEGSNMFYTVLRILGVDVAIVDWGIHESVAISEEDAIRYGIRKYLYFTLMFDGERFRNLTKKYYLLWDTGYIYGRYTQDQVLELQKKKLVYLYTPPPVSFEWSFTR